MAWDSAEPPAPERLEAAPMGRDEQPSEAPEQRFGPVAIARRVKDDGRALIIYRHAPEAQR